MSDRYSQLVNNPIGGFIAGNLGLPQPAELERYEPEPGAPVVHGPVLLGAAPGSTLVQSAAATLAGGGAQAYTALEGPLRDAAAAAGLDAKVWNPQTARGDQKFKALVFDASGITDSTQLRELHRFFGPTIRRILPSGRLIVLGTPPEPADGPRTATAQRALEGFVRSAAKELKRGATGQLVYVPGDGADQLESTLRFLLSPRSAYVSGQVIRIGASSHRPEIDWDHPLAAKVALVTGASRGIGQAIATVLARDGAHVVGLDVPAVAGDLDRVTSGIGGSSLTADITGEDAPRQIVDHLESEHGGVDIVVHNAGVTRDKTIGRMTEELWDLVLDINLSSEERINDELLGRGLINENGRIVCVSSISGIAGNAGQANYGTSKAGVIGMVQSMAPVVGERGVTINAVAPGFIETQMTAQIPIAIREAGRRMNSLSQGGLPVDVAETIAWYASPASAGVNGNVVRVCGQSLLGA